MGNHLKAVTGLQFKAVPWHITPLSCDKIRQKNTNQALFAAVTTASAHQELAAHLPLAFYDSLLISKCNKLHLCSLVKHDLLLSPSSWQTQKTLHALTTSKQNTFKGFT